MAPPAVGRPSASAAPEPPQRGAAKRRRAPACAGAGAGARILSLGVRGAVMAAALVLFLLFAAAAVILMLALLVAARAFRQQGRRRHRATPDPAPPPPPAVGLPSAKIRLLPCFEPSPCDGDPSSPRICPVCLDGVRARERWRALPACGHAFHAACVDRWLLLSPGCSRHGTSSRSCTAPPWWPSATARAVKVRFPSAVRRKAFPALLCTSVVVAVGFV